MLFSKFLTTFLVTAAFSSAAFASSEDELRSQLEAYFSFPLSGSENLSGPTRSLRVVAANIATTALSGERSEVVKNLTLLPSMLGEHLNESLNSEPLEVYRLMLLEDEIHQHLRDFNDGVRERRRSHKFWWTAGSVGLGAAGVVALFYAAKGPDMSGLVVFVFGSAIAVGVTALGATASSLIIDQIDSFREIEPAEFDFDAYTKMRADLDYSTRPPTKEVELYLAGETTIGDLERQIFFAGWTMPDFLRRWTPLVQDMEAYIASLEGDEKIAAISRALQFQSSVSDRIHAHNISAEEARRLRTLVSAGAGAAIGGALGYARIAKSEPSLGTTSFVLAVAGLAGATLGHWILPPIWGAVSDSPDRVQAEDFSILEADLLLD